MAHDMRGGDIVADALEACGIGTAFGIVSVHNLPILDALAARGRIRFIPTRGEAGAAAMADAFARAGGGLAAVVSSTGPGAGNAVASLMEAWIAGSPVLHITGQVPSHLIGRNGGSVHDCKDQLAMLDSVCKAAYRVADIGEIPRIIAAAAALARSAPMGPVSVEVPIDIQKRRAPRPVISGGLTAGVSRAGPSPVPVPAADALDRLADRVADLGRVMVWTGAGAVHAGAELARLAKLGLGVVTSMHGRGTLPEDHPMTLGAFNVQMPILDFYETVEAMIVAGSRLRGHETRDFTVPMPMRRFLVDVDSAADGRTYGNELFIHGDAALALHGLAERLEGRFRPDPAFAADLAAARDRAVRQYRDLLGVYADFCARLRDATPRDVIWARDITISNSSWGNRLFPVYRPQDNIYPVGAAIGLGIPFGIGAALGSGRKVLCLCGDGGLTLNIGELCTAVQEQADVVYLVMNDHGYGIIRNIQDAQYDGRRFFTEVHGPELRAFAGSVGLPHRLIDGLDRVGPVVAQAIAEDGPVLVEVDMAAIGPFSKAFPPPPADHNRKP